MSGRKSRAFTLIELLIVVLIIAILAAIAIPNFMEFQTRAKVSRIKSDQRTIATGLEAYAVDEGTYPASEYYYWGNHLLFHGLNRLTSPIAYLTSVPKDSFGDRNNPGEGKIGTGFEYGSGKAGVHASGWGTYPNDTWAVDSSGPDNDEDAPIDHGASGAYSSCIGASYPWPGGVSNPTNTRGLLAVIYDPTNGTVSSGQVTRAGGIAPPELATKMWFDIISR